MFLQGAGCVLIQTKEITVEVADITRIFGSDANIRSPSKGCRDYSAVDLCIFLP